MKEDQVVAKPLMVTVYDPSDIISLEKALKKLKKKIKNDKLMITIMEKSYYIKPSVKRNKQKNRWRIRKKYKRK